MHLRALLTSVAALLLAGLPALADSSALKAELKDPDPAAHWIYDDLPKAMAEAKATGKPLMIVLRCVPCPPGKKLDEAVMRPDADLEKLEKQFVCVRVIQTKGLDLQLFQYDYDQSWAAMFMNADKTIYGRYGTRDSHGPESDGYLTVPSFRKAAERALELHKSYPGNKQVLAAKTGKPQDWKTPESIPGLTDRADVPTVKKNCIHCHMVRENMVRTKWTEVRLTKEDLFVYPTPQRIGMTMEVDDGLKVKSVEEGSPAAKAGVKVGDEVRLLNGQPLLSTADIQWVLHTAPVETTVTAMIDRGGKPVEAKIALSGDWKEADLGWKTTSWFGLRRGLKVTQLASGEAEKRKIQSGKTALLVEGLFGNNAAALTKAGLKKGDVIVAMDGKSDMVTEGQFLVRLRLEHGPKDSVKFTVLRGEQKEEIIVPMW